METGLEGFQALTGPSATFGSAESVDFSCRHPRDGDGDLVLKMPTTPYHGRSSLGPQNYLGLPVPHGTPFQEKSPGQLIPSDQSKVVSSASKTLRGALFNEVDL